MTKNNFRILTIFAVMIILISTVAMATPEIAGNTSLSGSTFTTTINVTSVGENDEVSLLVVRAGTDLTKITAGDVICVDQTTADSGIARFTFVTLTDAFDVYSGYSTMAITDNPLYIKYKETVVFPGYDMQKSKLYTNTRPFDLNGYKRVFIKLANENGSWIPIHSDQGTEIYYSTELGGYDGMVKTTSEELSQILSQITWLKGVPSADATIAKYGDVSGDGRINIDDYVSVRKSILGSITYTIKQNLLADVADDGAIRVDDYVDIRKFLLGSLNEFKAVSQRK